MLEKLLNAILNEERQAIRDCIGWIGTAAKTTRHCGREADPAAPEFWRAPCFAQKCCDGRPFASM
jgi:hypothetical protein